MKQRLKQLDRLALGILHFKQRLSSLSLLLLLLQLFLKVTNDLSRKIKRNGKLLKDSSKTLTRFCEGS
jgi:hypothetical protein